MTAPASSVFAEPLAQARAGLIVRDWLPDMDSDMQQAFRAVLSTRKEQT